MACTDTGNIFLYKLSEIQKGNSEKYKGKIMKQDI